MRTVMTVLAAIAVLTTPGYGWSEAGHRIIASITFRQLTPEERAKVIEILQVHPRFQAEFEDEAPVWMPTRNRSGCSSRRRCSRTVFAGIRVDNQRFAEADAAI